MSTMPKAFPKNCLDGVVAIVMRREALFAHLAKDFEMSALLQRDRERCCEARGQRCWGRSDWCAL